MNKIIFCMALLLLASFAFAATPTPIVIQGGKPVNITSAGTQVVYVTNNESLKIDDFTPFFISIRQNFADFHNEQVNQSARLAYLEVNARQMESAYSRMQIDYRKFMELRWGTLFIFILASGILMVCFTPIVCALLFVRAQKHFIKQLEARNKGAE